MSKTTAGYSPAQIGLHWAVVVLVAFQFAAHNGIEAAWTALLRSGDSRAGTVVLAYMHIGAGMAIFVLALVRIYLRLTRGAPPPPADEPKLLQLLAESVHVAIYGLLLVLPLTGMAAWFVPLPVAGSIHALLTNALLAAISLHVAGALFQHFIRRSEVLVRMFRPQPDGSAAPAQSAATPPT